MIIITTRKLTPGSHYIGRLGESALGNPFTTAGTTVKAVVQGFRYYLFLVTTKELEPLTAARTVAADYPALHLHIATSWRVPTRADVLAELTTLKAKAATGDLHLGCHCVSEPEPFTDYRFHCHGEVLASFLLSSR